MVLLGPRLVQSICPVCSPSFLNPRFLLVNTLQRLLGSVGAPARPGAPWMLGRDGPLALPAACLALRSGPLHRVVLLSVVAGLGS